MAKRDNCKQPNGTHDTYLSHVDNLRSIEYSIKDQFQILKLKIKKDEISTPHYSSSLKNLILLLGIWSESRLNKLLSEPDAFTAREIDIINLYKQKIAQWNIVVELSFRKHYSIHIGEELNEDNLGKDNFHKYNKIQDTIRDYLKVIVEMRNKLAHGQWCCQLNKSGNSLNTETITILNNENYISLQVKYQLLKYFGDLIYLLAVSNPAFSTQFESLYKEINDRSIRLQKHVDNEHLKFIDKIRKRQNR